MARVWCLVVAIFVLLAAAEAFLGIGKLQSRVLSLQPLPALYAAPKGKVADKVRVKLLADVKGLGKKSEIVMVSKAQWQNVMAPQKIAQQISDEEMKKIESDSREGQATQKKAALDLSTLISALPTSSIARKVGANEKLFGSVNLKNVLDELAAQIPDSAEALAAKSVSVEELYDCGGEKEEKVKIGKTWEIRNAGQFRVVLHLHPEVPAASFRFDIVPE